MGPIGGPQDPDGPHVDPMNLAIWVVIAHNDIDRIMLVYSALTGFMIFLKWNAQNYRKTSNISRTLVCYEIVDHWDVAEASPVGAAPTTSSC